MLATGVYIWELGSMGLQAGALVAGQAYKKELMSYLDDRRELVRLEQSRKGTHPAGEQCLVNSMVHVSPVNARRGYFRT